MPYDTLAPDRFGAIKGDRKILVVLRPVARDAGTDRVKDFYRQPLGIGLRLQHERRRRGNESHFLHALATMPADVARSPVEWPAKMASLRSSASITAARSSAYPSMSFAEEA